MHYSAFSRLRDILFLLALIFLVNIAVKRTTSFIEDHKESIIHELDRSFIDELYTTQRQLHTLKNYIDNGQTNNTIADISSRLTAIEEKYKKNSPGVMFLGPIGSAAIISKEEKMRKKLLEVANDINNLLHNINKRTDLYYPIETIHVALENNRKLLQELTA